MSILIHIKILLWDFWVLGVSFNRTFHLFILAQNQETACCASFYMAIFYGLEWEQMDGKWQKMAKKDVSLYKSFLCSQLSPLIHPLQIGESIFQHIWSLEYKLWRSRAGGLEWLNCPLSFNDRILQFFFKHFLISVPLNILSDVSPQLTIWLSSHQKENIEEC